MESIMCLGRCKIEDSGEDLKTVGWKIDDFGRPEAKGNVWKLDETGKFAGHERGWMLWVKSRIGCQRRRNGIGGGRGGGHRAGSSWATIWKFSH